MFYTKDVNSAGCYLVYFYVNGAKTPVIIDDYLPVTQDGVVAFASSKNQEIWVSLLEKAWAKLHGSYARTESGIPYFAYSQLCGLPGTGKDHKEVLQDPKKLEQLWNLLKACDKRNFVMLAATHGEGGQ